MSVTAFLPCRAGSQRVPRKNTRPFAGEADGLLGVKIAQLAACDRIDKVMVSTNDPEVVAITQRLAANDPKIVIDHRPDALCSSSTSTDEVVDYVPTVITSGAMLWTHVTSPFVDADEYARMIDAYRAATEAGTHDSLMAVTTLRTFLWMKDAPLNYDRNVEKWPRTQTLEPVYAVNSAAFIIDVALMASLRDRVGAKPWLHEMDERVSFDVDWEEQFHLAEKLYQIGAGRGSQPASA